MKIQLAVFDMDGTILDTLEDLSDSLNAALRQAGLPERSLDEARQFVGNGIRRLVERGVPEGTDPEVTERVLRDFTAHYEKHCAEKTRAYEGIPEALRALRGQGIATAVVSNKADFAVQELAERYFPGLFDAVVGERAGVRRKPMPDSVQAVLRQLAIPPENAVYIGDSDVDILTAEGAGLPCISVTWGFRSEEFLREHGAAAIARTPREMVRQIAGE